MKVPSHRVSLQEPHRFCTWAYVSPASVQQFADSDFWHFSKFSPKFLRWVGRTCNCLWTWLVLLVVWILGGSRCYWSRFHTFPCYAWEGAAMPCFLVRNHLVCAIYRMSKDWYMLSSKWKWGLGLHGRRWSRSYGLLSFIGSLKRVQAWDGHKHPQACCQQFCEASSSLLSTILRQSKRFLKQKKLNVLLEL